jgi:hypothetical protein
MDDICRHLLDTTLLALTRQISPSKPMDARQVERLGFWYDVCRIKKNGLVDDNIFQENKDNESVAVVGFVSFIPFFLLKSLGKVTKRTTRYCA